MVAHRRGHHDALFEWARRDHEVLVVNGEGLDPGRRGVAARVALGLTAARAARRFGPDVVLSSSLDVVVSGVPTVVTFEEEASSMLVESVHRVQARRAAAYITATDAGRGALLRLGVGAAKISVIPAGVDTDRFFPRELPPGPPVAPAGTSFPPLPPVRFAYPGAILPGKGQHAAIDALGRMRPDQRYRAHLTVVGRVVDRIYLDQLKVQAFRLPVTFAIDVDDIVPWYQAADVILFPTLVDERHARTAVESMACGKALVYYDQPELRAIVGDAGVAVARDDAEGLRNTMLRLIAEPDERRRLGALGRQRIEARGWQPTWARYREVLSRVVRRPSRGD